jgi:hypothetical protein
MLDSDIDDLYGVETRKLNQAVLRNEYRFPDDFMFELSKPEYESLRCQFGTLKRGEHLPYGFTEQGVAMLSSVLSSKQAIAVNIEIMRVFTNIRKMLFDNTELRLMIEEIRKKTENNTKNIEVVFQYLDEFIEKAESKKENEPKPKPRKLIGYNRGKKIR